MSRSRTTIWLPPCILFWMFATSVMAQSTTSPTAVPTDTQKQNVLIFFVDDLRPELGCYGVDSIKSPAIDALASQGVVFDRAYCQQALCAPSRISMMTGQYPDSTGICDLFTPLRRHNKKKMTIPMYFQQQGYRTASFGKVYHHLIDDKNSWSEIPAPPSDKYADPQTLQAIADRVQEAKAQKLDITQTRLAAKGPATESYVVDDEGYRDGVVARQAIESLRKSRDENSDESSAKPFFMCVGFAKPHLPFAAPQRYWDLYDRDQFAIPDRQRPGGAPDLAFTVWGELRSYRGMPKTGELTDELTRELIHGYAASVSFADAQVGRVMAELDQLGLRDETIVVLWGDHGYKLGDYGCWCKHTNFELDTHVPLIVSAPGFERGKRTKALVEIVDIFPSLVTLSGGQVPSSCDGKTFQSILENPTDAFRPFALSQYPRGSTMGYSLRNDRYRYTEWIQAGTKRVVARELYDHQETQSPNVSLADKPEYAELVSSLSEQLDAASRVETTQVKLKR